MKKFLILAMLVLCSAAMPSFAASFSSDVMELKDIVAMQTKVSEVGIKILNKNEIEKRTVFRFDSGKTVNAHSSFRDREIVIYRGMYTLLDDENMLAAVLSHEISHSVESYEGAFRGFFTQVNYYCAPKKYEYIADKRAVDYMVGAGYNPVALIVVMNKAFGQTRYDWCSTHPLTSRRMMEVYEYIYKKYPQYLAKNEYKNNPYYINFLLTSKDNRAKFQHKIETNSKLPVLYL